jgi:hypothetical protein
MQCSPKSKNKASDIPEAVRYRTHPAAVSGQQKPALSLNQTVGGEKTGTALADNSNKALMA